MKARAAWIGAGVLVLLVALGATAWWGLHTTAGAAALLRWVPGLTVTQPRGSLLGGEFGAARIEWAGADATRVTLEAPQWRGLVLGRATGGPAWLKLQLASLTVARLVVETAPATPGKSAPPSVPTDLQLPLELAIERVDIGELQLAALGDKPVRAITLALYAGERAGSQHRIENLKLGWDQLSVAGRAQIGTRAPLPLEASIALAPSAAGTASTVGSTRGASPATGSTPGTSAATGTTSGTSAATGSTSGTSAATGRTPGTTATGSTAATTPSASDATSTPSAPPLPDWRAQLELRGPLDDLSAGAALRAVADSSRQEAPALDLSAQLRPFADWPLAALQAQARSLDLSQLASSAPHTLLDAQAQVDTRGWTEPARVRLTLKNRAAGRLDAARVPLRQAQIELEGRPDESRRLAFQTFDIELGTEAEAAGRLSGSGGVNLDAITDRLNLDAKLEGVRPALLDARANPMTLDGPLTLVVTRLSQPDRELALKADLEAQLSELPQRARLQLDVSANTQRLELRKARAAVGEAIAELGGSAVRRDAAWQLAGQARLDRFDPRPYWRGSANSPWRQGPHRLDASLAFDLAVADAAQAAKTWQAQLAAITGQATLKLLDSQLAGVPLKGELVLNGRGPQFNLVGQVDAAGNRLQLDARVATDAARASSDHWQATLQAPALAALAPLLRLAQPDGAAPLGLAGSAELQASADGRWPALRSSGTAKASGLRASGFSVRGVDTRWSFAASDSAPLELDLNLDTASVDGKAEQRIDSASLRARGSWAAHTVELKAESPLRPPGWVDSVTGAPAGGIASAASASAASAAGGRDAATATAATATSGTASTATTAAATSATTVASAASAAAASSGPSAPAATAQRAVAGASGTATGTRALVGFQGNLIGGPAAPTAWRGSLNTVEIGERTPQPGQRAAPWLSTRDVRAAIDLDPATHQPRGVTVEAGRADILGAALRWSRLLWQDRPDGDRVEADATLEPMQVAPLLQRLQGDFGWGGTLAVQGSVSVRTNPTLQADVVLERAAGDLTVTDPALPKAPAQPLGLTDLRLGLVVRDGTWSFSEALAGRTLGNAAGAQVLRTDPKAVWPGPDTPLEGVLQANVADLGAWGAWLPAGWRLAGSLDAGASFGGRFAAPAYTGHVRGQGLGVRNLLQGVNVTDGVVAIALQGETARIEQFSAKAGSGKIDISGDASFGATPRARLRVVADHFQLLGRVDRRVVTSGQATLQLDPTTIDLKGGFGVDEGLIDFSRSDAPGLSDDVEVIGTTAASADVPTVAQAPAPKRNVALDLAVDLGDKLRVRGRGLDSRLGGNLHLTAPGGRLAVNGTVRTRAGTYAAYGQKLEVERGELVFSGPVESPRLDILAIRPDLDVRVGVSVIGTVQAPRVRLISEPAMSDIDKLSWLVLGRAGDELGRTDTALLQRAAVMLLSGEGGGPTDQITKALGLDTISLRQSDTDSTQTVVALGKQLSRRWYVGYERSLNATAGTFQLIYRVAQRFTLRAQSGADNSLDAIWTWRWQ